MSIPKDFVVYVKAAWLADLPFEEFLLLEQHQVSVANATYSNLDSFYYRFVVATYDKPDFLKRSYELDRKKNNA